MKEIVLYARSATVGQADKTGVKSQLRELRNYAQKHGYAVIKEYTDEGQSGSHLLRPGLTQLRKDMERGQVQVVLTKDQTRLSRNVVDHVVLEGLFRKHGVAVEYVDAPSKDSATQSFVNNMLTVFGDSYMSLLSKQVKAGMKLKRSKETEKTPQLGGTGVFSKAN